MSDRTAVLYATKGGVARDYAQTVADTLSAQGLDVDLLDLKEDRHPDLGPYRNVVFGTGVRIGRLYRRGKKFLRQENFDGKRLAIFLASGIAIDDPERSQKTLLDPIVEKYHLQPVMLRAFPGRIPGSWRPDTSRPEEVRAWAEELAKKLQE